MPSASLVPLLIAGLLTALTVLVFKRQLFDHWTFPWDFLGPHATTPAFVAAVVGSGHIPSWSPFVASGFPAEVDPQVGVYFPGWWLLGGLGIPATLRVLTAVQVAHALLGSLGVLALARVRQLRWRWATVAAVAYLFFGGFYGESEHADIVRGFAYIPWVLWALTPPASPARWTRLMSLPLLAWLIASGAYPGQVVSFGLAGAVYVGLALWASEGEEWRRHRGALALAVVSSAAVCAAVLLPYLRADQAHELYRVFEPTASVRAGESIGPIDFLGLYLNNFAWTYDGTITSWAIGIPVLIGLACMRWQALRRHMPLAVCGVVALALAMTPKIGVIGKAMASIRPLFPSRFPAADYKAVVAVAMVVLAAEAWSDLSMRRDGLRWRVLVAGCALVAGALFAATSHEQPTHRLWLVIIVIVCSGALALANPPSRWLACLLVSLVAVDGVRAIHDYRFQGNISPWQVSPAQAAPFRARDRYVRELPKRLEQAPASRPARIPPFVPLSVRPTGTPPDNSGWVADGYHLTDYDSTIERVRWQAEQDSRWRALLLESWHGYTFSCAVVGCGAHAVHLPSPSTWRPSTQVRTVSYGTDRIVYAVNVTQPTLMVENELPIKGWVPNTARVRLVKAGIPLRAWRLTPGDYEFAATYQPPGRSLQELAALMALAAWLGSVVLLLRQRRNF